VLALRISGQPKPDENRQESDRGRQPIPLLLADCRIACERADHSDDYASDTGGDERDAEGGRAHVVPSRNPGGIC
jgi:hypothetical protein